jgi:cell filamentation protein
MYQSEPDPYCYPGTAVLINCLNLRDQAALDGFEAEITSQRATEPLPAGHLSYRHYRAIHRHLFQDVYPWAGKIRTVRLSKNGNTFCYPEHIDREMRLLFSNFAKHNHFRALDAAAFARKTAHFLAEVNAIHPFREGNGRAQLSFVTLLAERAGRPLNMQRLNPKAMLHAMITSFGGNERPLIDLLASLV